MTLISLAYRSCVHPALAETPFFPERGRDAIISQELPVEAPVCEKRSVKDYRRLMRKRLLNANKVARDLDRETKQRQDQKKNEDEARYTAEHSIHSLV